MKQALRIYRDPIPEALPKRRSKYPFAQMEVGDCFYVPAKDVRSLNVVASAARQWTRRNRKDRKFATRRIGDMIGIWRVE